MHPLALLAGELLLKAAGKKLQEKKGKKPEVAKATAEVFNAVHEDPKSTAISAIPALVAVILATMDLSPEMAEQISPLIQQGIAGLFGVVALLLATWKKKDK